jgi:hypothetical protein
MSAFKFDFCFTSIPHGVTDVEGRIEIDVFSTGRPAYTSGAPEDCYPGEPVEYDLLEIEVIVGTSRTEWGFDYTYAPLPTDDFGKALDAAIRADLDEGEIIAAIYEQATSASEDYADWRRDQKRDDFFEQAMKVAGR